MARRPRMRPQFEIPLQSSGDAVLRTLGGLLNVGADEVVGQVRRGCAVLQVSPERRSMLSPFLNLEVVERASGPVLQGRFSPQPNVWTGFLALYAALGMVAFLCAMFGLSQWWLGHPAWVLLGIPAAAAAIAFVYGAAVIGQGLTADEMYDLRALVDRAVREHAETDPSCGTAPDADRMTTR